MTNKKEIAVSPYNVTFTPMIKDGKEVGPISEELPSHNKFMQYSLPKGRYDIDYVINLLRIIFDKVEDGRFSPRDLQFTLSHSIKSLLGMLEVEKFNNLKE